MAARILVIEDHATSLDLMVYLLTAYGYTVVTAQSGEEGITMACQEVPELILCDVRLPHMDGYEVMRWLKSHPQLRTIPLLAVTALAMVGDRDKLLAAGFDGYVVKPITPETFVADVEQFLHDHHGSLPRPARSSAGQPASPPQTGGMTVLVVDDLTVNLELARCILEPFGHTVLTARRTAEALALARSSKPDVILSDVQMADGLGYDFITTVKADVALRGIPFVFITSTFVSSKDRAQGLRLGAARYLTRPIEPQALLAELTACLREEHPAAKP